MVATWNPAASAGYYIQQTAYYLDDAEPMGRWFAPNSDLGIQDGGEVDRATFERLFAGLDTDGNPLSTHAGGRLDRVPAFDITLSAPRSVALAWALGDEETQAAIAGAQAKATRATLDLLVREAAWARRGRNGVWVEQVTLTAATFQHGESRPAHHSDGKFFSDPNLHTHCVVLNLARRADGTVGALHSTALRDWKMASGATYHAALAAELQALGFELGRIGKNGTFELVGIGDTAITYFSARRSEIEDALAEHGTSSAHAVALAAAITKSSRKSKLVAATEQCEIVWREAARAQGFALTPHDLAAMRRAPSVPVQEELLRERLRALPTLLTATESVIDRRELFRAVASTLVGTGVGPDRVTAIVADLIQHRHILEIGQDAVGRSRYTTPEMLRIEQAVVALTSDLARSGARSLDPNDIRRRCGMAGLSPEQTEAALAATGGQRLAVIEGAPGTGKTTTLTPVVAAWRDAGYTVLGAATAWRIAGMLRDDLGVKARAIASWLAGVDHGRTFLDDRSLLVVDEAGLLSAREMHALLTEVTRAGARLLLVGDRKQLQAIGAGPGLALVTRALEAARVETIVRQRNPWQRDAVTAFGAGHAAAALAAFDTHDAWVEADGAKAAIRAMAERWAWLREKDPTASVLLLAKTNAETRAIGMEVRARLKASGAIHGPELTVDTVTPSGQPARIALAAGDSIRFLARHDDIGVINGSLATIVSVTPLGHIVADCGGRRIGFAPGDIADEMGRAHLSWAYAATIHGAQGLTVDHGLVLLTPGFNRHDIYVAASRARHGTQLIVDRAALDRQILAERGIYSTSLADSVDPAARRDWLAKRLERRHVKETTLDALVGDRSPHPMAWEAGHER